MQMSCPKEPFESSGYGENGETVEISPTFLAKVEDIMQMTVLIKGPIESGGYGENDGFGGFGETDEISPKSLMKVEDIMQMSWLQGPFESGGYGQNNGFGEKLRKWKILCK